MARVRALWRSGRGAKRRKKKLTQGSRRLEHGGATERKQGKAETQKVHEGAGRKPSPAVLTAGVAGPPVAPGGGIGAEAGAGDVLQGLEDPAARGRVKGGVVHHLE